MFNILCKDPYKDIVPLCKNSWDTISKVSFSMESIDIYSPYLYLPFSGILDSFTIH